MVKNGSSWFILVQLRPNGEDLGEVSNEIKTMGQHHLGVNLNACCCWIPLVVGVCFSAFRTGS